MQEAEVMIINKLGLHARAAGKLVNLTKTFSSEITVAREGDEVDAKSIMAVMLLAAPVGTRIRLKICGEDEEAAMAAVSALINSRFGEEE